MTGTASKCPRLTIRALASHATAEFDVLHATLIHWNTHLMKTTLGNPSSATMSDIVTLTDGKPYLSIGSWSVCPRALVPVLPCVGFAALPNKKVPPPPPLG